MKVRFCSGLYKECEIPLPAAPFCRAVELAAHWRRSELPFVALSIRPSVSNSCAHGSGLASTVVPGDVLVRVRQSRRGNRKRTALPLGVCRPKACFSVGLQQLKPTTMLSIS